MKFITQIKTKGVGSTALNSETFYTNEKEYSSGVKNFSWLTLYTLWDFSKKNAFEI